MRESQRPSEKPRQTRQTRQASAQSRRTASKRYEERAKRSKRHGQRHEQHGAPWQTPRTTSRAAEISAARAAAGIGRTACAADRIDAVGGVQRRHRARCAVAYRGICAAIAQMAGRQSFGDACNAGISCAGRRARCSRSAADIAEIVGNERFRKRSALHRKHGIVDLLAIGERAVGQRMFGDNL